jgi:hypothetical protein
MEVLALTGLLSVRKVWENKGPVRIGCVVRCACGSVLWKLMMGNSGENGISVTVQIVV